MKKVSIAGWNYEVASKLLNQKEAEQLVGWLFCCHYHPLKLEESKKLFALKEGVQKAIKSSNPVDMLYKEMCNILDNLLEDKITIQPPNDNYYSIMAIVPALFVDYISDAGEWESWWCPMESSIVDQRWIEYMTTQKNNELIEFIASLDRKKVRSSLWYTYDESDINLLGRFWEIISY